MSFLVVEEKNKIDKKVASSLEYNFDIPESSIYSIEIIASAKSWWQ